MKKILSLFFILTFLVAGTVHALTYDDIELLIRIGVIPQDKAEQALQLVANQSQQVPSVTTTSSCPTLTQPMWQGSTDATANGEVSLLQGILRKSGLFATQPQSGVFDSTTKEAVKTFQRSIQMFSATASESEGYGSVGPRTRQAIKTYLCVTQVENTPSTPVTSVAQDNYRLEQQFEATVSMIRREISYDLENQLYENGETTWEFNNVCREFKDSIRDIENEYDANVTCVDEDYSLAVSITLDDYGDDLSYCFDSVGYRGLATAREVDDVAFCSYIGADLSIIKAKSAELEELATEYRRLGYESNIEYARVKGANAAIKANINNARAQAELYYDDSCVGGECSYDKVCTTESNGVARVVEAVNEIAEKSRATCYDHDDSWAMYSELNGHYEGGYCVDSTGYAGSAEIRNSGGRAYCSY